MHAQNKKKALVDELPTEDYVKNKTIRWTALSRFSAFFLFGLISILAELIIVNFSMSLGVVDSFPLQWILKIPGVDWSIAITVSPMFHLVPITVVITLTSSWTYLSKRVSINAGSESRQAKTGTSSKRTAEQKRNTFSARISSGLSKVKGLAFLERKVRLARAAIRATAITLLVFVAFIFVISLFAYPQLIYRTLANLYQTNLAFLSFVKETGSFLAPVGSVFSALNGVLAGSSSVFRDFALALGNTLEPLTALDNTGKYLVLQNAAAWISVVAIVLYGEYGRKSSFFTGK